MKLRHATTIVLLAIMSVLAVAHPATAALTTTPIKSPSVALLKPTSSTHVAAGEKIHFTYNFGHVKGRPYVTMYFRKDWGARQAVNLSVATVNYITVPATWTAGRYRLDSVLVESMNAKGEHFRNYLYTGTDYVGNSYRTYTRFNLAVMDIYVTK